MAQITSSSTQGFIIHRRYRSAETPIRIDVQLSGSGATVLFGLDDTVDASVGQFVRIADGMIEAGRLRGTSAVELTGRASLPPSDDGWISLSIRINQPASTYDVLINDTLAMERQELVCPGGWIGLRAPDASGSFRHLVVRQQPIVGQAARRGPEMSVHRLRYVRAGAGNLVVHDPERNLLLAMDLKGKVLKSAPPRFPVRATTEASAGGKTYRISNGRVTVTPGNGADGSSRTDTIGGPITHAVALVADRDGSVYVTDAGDPGVHQIGPGGRVVRTWKARLLGGFIAPHGIDLLGTKELAVADYDRVVILAKGKDEENPEITPGSKSVVVEWTLPSAVAPYAEVSEDGVAWRRVTGESPAGGGKARVVIGGLEPATTYLVRFGPVVKTIPVSAGVSRPQEASTLWRDPSSAEAR
jgi:hypothetical protein